MGKNPFERFRESDSVDEGTNSQRIGDFIRQRRQANGLTQRELGELAGVGTRFISEVERGKPTVRLDVVDLVLSVFGKQLGVVDRRAEALEAAEAAT